MEEYLKQKAESKSKLAAVTLPAPRKANEGVDSKEAKKWKDYKPLKRDDEELVVPKKKADTKTENQKESERAEDKKKAEKVPVDQVLRIQAPKRDRPPRERREREKDETQEPSPRSRGGRGGGRGRGSADRDRDRDRAKRNQQQKEAPNVTDEASFPSLAAKA